MQLLEKGYNVRATLRDPTDQSKSKPLLALAAALPGANYHRQQQQRCSCTAAPTQPVSVQLPAAAAKCLPSSAASCPHAGTLQLFAADLLEEGSFDAAVAGSKFVFHLASPFFIEAQDPQAQLVDPAVKGTANLMGSVARHKESVSRVVLTSSVAGEAGGAGWLACRVGWGWGLGGALACWQWVLGGEQF